VINDPSYVRADWGWVVPEESHVMTRYFFVYNVDSATQASMYQLQVDATSFTPPDEEYYGLDSKARDRQSVVLAGVTMNSIRAVQTLLVRISVAIWKSA
jgi:hypothetical protein